jgi:glucosamine-6-phosphate deaminase
MTINLNIFKTATEMGRAAAEKGASQINAAIQIRNSANIIVATGASQFEMLKHLITLEIPWHQVTVFHLDEYVGLPITHPASFRGYLWNRFASQLPVPTAGFHYLNGESNPNLECDRIARLIKQVEIDVAFVGVGENGHLAFNDPPADFETDSPFIVVDLDEACRQQQHREGWFPTLDDVPKQAISMSIRQIMKSKSIVCTVPDERKATAIKNCLEQEISPTFPASILRTHSDCHLYLDHNAASQLSQ